MRSRLSAFEIFRRDSWNTDPFRNLDLDIENLESLSLKKINKKLQNRVESEIISYVLTQTGWNRKRAAKVLDISYRAILYKIKDLNLENPTGNSMIWDI